MLRWNNLSFVKTVIKTPLKKQRIKFCFNLQSFATLNCFVFSNELLCCAQFHILQDKVLPHVWLCRVQIRFHNVRACISVSRAPYGDQHPEEDMRNGVIGHSEAPVMMNHSSNERCVNYEQRNLCQHHSDQDGKIITSYIFSIGCMNDDLLWCSEIKYSVTIDSPNWLPRGSDDVSPDHLQCPALCTDLVTRPETIKDFSPRDCRLQCIPIGRVGQV